MNLLKANPPKERVVVLSMKRLLLVLVILFVADSARSQMEFTPSGFGKPQVGFSQKTYDFNSQAIGSSNCINLPLVNQTDRSCLLTALRSNLGVYTIVSPAEEMLPIQIPAGGTMYLSVCFAPIESRNYNGRITAVFSDDSTQLVVTGSGIVLKQEIKPTANDLRVKPKKKGSREFIFEVDLMASSSIELTVSDPLGKAVKSYTNGELKAAGPYQFTFEGVDGNGDVLPAGKYYVKLTVGDFKSTKTIEIPQLKRKK